MERLTARSAKGLKLRKGKKFVELLADKQLTLNAINRLAELEDKLESGLLIELPCIEPFETCNIETGEPSICYNVLYRDKNSGELIIECEVDKAEAESLLEELKGETK